MHSRPRPRWWAAALASSLALGAAPAGAATPDQIDAAVASAAAWVRTQQQADGSIPGFNGDWAVTSLAAAGVHPADVATSGTSLQDWLGGRLASDDYRLATMPPWTVAGDLGKAALLAHAAGIPPTHVAPDVNLAAALATKWDAAAGTFDGPRINSDGFALLAADQLYLPRGVREKLVALIRASQHADGGWTFVAGGNLGTPGDVDMTGAALAMLCGEGATPADRDVAEGLAFLHGKQDAATGGIVAGPWVPPLNAPSNAWALLGLNACGVEPWTSSGGKTITDFLLGLQRADGSVKYVASDDDAGAPNDMNATESTLRALAGAAFAVDPPARSPRRRAVAPVPDGTPVPIALGVDDRAGDVRYCGVTVDSGAPLGTLLATAAADGCIVGPQLAAVPGSAWLASIDGGGFAPAGAQPVRAGDSVNLELRAWPLVGPAVAFGAQARDTIGAAQAVTLTAVADGVRPAGVTAGDEFVVAGDTCSAATLDAGETCAVRLRFAPSGVGARAGTLLVRDAAGDAIAAVELTGSGEAGSVASSGAPGRDGAPGAPGAAGPRGRDARVTCRIVRKAGKRRVRCSVRRVRGSTRARLLRGGRTYAKGRLAALRPTRHVTRGTYRLRIGDSSLRVRVG